MNVLRAIAIVFACVVALVAARVEPARAASQVTCKDLKGPRLTKRRIFRVQIVACPKSVAVGRNSLWTVRITKKGKPMGNDATVSLDGGMPPMGHKFYTQPYVLRARTAGLFVLKMRFSMRGRWYFQITIAHNRVADTVRYWFDV